jgi:hypothetical protein
MSLIVHERPHQSPYIESITYGATLAAARVVRPAEIHWHLVLRSLHGQRRAILVGPWSASGIAQWGADAELIWLKFKLGTYMPQMPVRTYLNREIELPSASGRAFWLDASAWEMPSVENIDVFVERLVRRGVLAFDPLIRDVLDGYVPNLAPRTVRHRFLRATGLTQSQLLQYQRANQAASLLASGHSIADAMFEVGYFDQPHLTRSLKLWLGHTPAQIVRLHQIRNCRSVQDIPTPNEYATDVLMNDR